MKTIRKILMLSVFASLLVFTACEPEPKPVVDSEIQLDYESYPTDYSIIVSNLSGKNLVLFKNVLTPDNIVGAVKAYATQQYLKKNPALFAATGSFRLIAITEDDFKKNKDNLTSLTNKPFTRVYAFYNAAGTNDNVYEISGDLGGEYKLTIQNTTNYHVELHSKSKTGEIIGYAPKMSADTVLYLDDGTYTVFPVFIKYNKLKDCIFRVIPTFPETATVEALRGFPKYDFFTLGDGETEELTHDFMAADFKNNEYNFISGSAYLTVINESKVAIQLKKGTAVVTTNTGSGQTIAAGKGYTYEIPFVQKVDGSYPTSTTITKGTYKIGTGLAYVDVNEKTWESDTMYQIKVTGNDAASLVLGEITYEGKIDWDSMDDDSY